MKKFIKFIYNFQTREEMLRTSVPSFWGKAIWLAARTTRNLTVLAVFVATSASSALAYNYFNPNTVYADRTVEVPTEQDIPILEKIIQCESGGSHYAKNGQLKVNINVQDDGTKSIDVGVGQINVSVWGATATKMGYDLTKETDNRAFTRWLFLNKGSAPWYSSSKCWNK